MTLHMYADKKDWPLESVTVRLTQRKIHAADCESDAGYVDHVEREIELQGPLQRQLLAEIADRCPVHRTMEGTIKIETVLADT